MITPSVLQVPFPQYQIALVRHEYSEENAYEMLEEVKGKIYSQYPKVKTEDEVLTGARMYVSEIARKYNNRDSKSFDIINQNDVIVKVEERSSMSEERKDPSQDKLDNIVTKIKGDFNIPQEEAVILLLSLESSSIV